MLTPATPQSNTADESKNTSHLPPGKQLCPVCSYMIGSLAGSSDAVCKNCGFKDPCCE